VSAARYTSSATVRTPVVNDKVVMFHSLPGASEDDASNLKDFWTPTDQGGQFAVYEKESAFFWTFIVWHYELVKVTSTLAVRQFTVS
jgi:hypothetical protein